MDDGQKVVGLPTKSGNVIQWPQKTVFNDGDIVIGVPNGAGGYYIFDALISSFDKQEVLGVPKKGGGYTVARKNFGVIGLPIKVTDGKSSGGYTWLGTFPFQWDGTVDVYLSGAPDHLAPITFYNCTVDLNPSRKMVYAYTTVDGVITCPPILYAPLDSGGNSTKFSNMGVYIKPISPLPWTCSAIYIITA